MLKKILLILLSATVLSLSGMDGVVFYSSFNKANALYEKSPMLANSSSLELTNDGLAFGEGYCAPNLNLKNSGWNGNSGTIGFWVRPENWDYTFDQPVIFIKSFFKNGVQPKSDFKLFFRPPSLQIRKHSLFFNTSDGNKQNEILFLDIDQFRFEKNKWVHLALSWNNG